MTIRAVAGLDLRVQELDDVIQDARNSLISRQRDDGHWIFEFEADATISSDYVMLHHFLGEVDDAFLGAQPTKLAVIDQIGPEPAQVGGDGLERSADEFRA